MLVAMLVAAVTTVIAGLALVFLLLALLLFCVLKNTGDKTRDTIQGRTRAMTNIVENFSGRIDKVALIAKVENCDYYCSNSSALVAFV